MEGVETTSPNSIRVNMYPLSTELEVTCSVFSHRFPDRYARYLRFLGCDARVTDGQVVALHVGPNPDPSRRPQKQWRLEPGEAFSNWKRGANAYLRKRLTENGFVRLGPTVFCDVRQPEKLMFLPFPIHAHLAWAWDWEHVEGRVWFVPLVRRKYLSGVTLEHPGLRKWVIARSRVGQPIALVHLGTGKRARLKAVGEKAEETLDAYRDWHVTLDMESLKEFSISQQTYWVSQFSFSKMEALLREIPIASLITPKPKVVSPKELRRVQGSCLEFGSGRGRDMWEVLGKGVLQKPPRRVRVVVVVPNRLSEKERWVLTAHVFTPSHQKYRRYIQLGLKELRIRHADRDPLHAIWNQQLGIPPFDVAVCRYDEGTGTILSGEKVLREETESRTVALVVIKPDLPRPVFETLMGSFRDVRAVPVKLETLACPNNRWAWVNVAVELATKAGARPWRIAGMPAVGKGTFFLGIDLGHHHAADQSRLGLVLIDGQGCEQGNLCVPLPLCNERIAKDDFERAVRQLFKQSKIFPQYLIVHRDGRYHAGEPEAIGAVLRQLGIAPYALVSIKKDAFLRFSDGIEAGDYLPLSSSRALLVTNVQARGRSMPAPLEIELVEDGGLTLEEAVAQVFWLTRVYQGSLYHPTRLPFTTRRANNIAGTGSKLHTKSFYASPQSVG